MTICHEQSTTTTSVQLIKVTKITLNNSQKCSERHSNFK